MSTNFHIGQKVVCVDDRWPSRKGTIGPLSERVVYTIKGFAHKSGLDANSVWRVNFCLVLTGVSNPERYEGEDDFGFSAARFRPVADRKTEISIFTNMLIKSKRPIPA